MWFWFSSCSYFIFQKLKQWSLRVSYVYKSSVVLRLLSALFYSLYSCWLAWLFKFHLVFYGTAQQNGSQVLKIQFRVIVSLPLESLCVSVRLSSVILYIGTTHHLVLFKLHQRPTDLFSCANVFLLLWGSVLPTVYVLRIRVPCAGLPILILNKESHRRRFQWIKI